MDWPYGSPFWLAEATAETGAADWVTTRAIRYQFPEFVDGLKLEGTYDVGTSRYDAATKQNAKARLFEIAASYSIGALALDFTHQRKSGSPTTLGVGEFGNDGSPTASTTQEQSAYFLGARYNFGGGLDATLGYHHNEWQDDAGNVLGGFSWAGHGATAGTKVTNARVLAGLTYRWDKWRLSGAVEKVQEGQNNVAGGLNDAATILGIQLARQRNAAGAQAYIGLRRTKFDGVNIPIDSLPWQVQNAGATADSNMRLGIGAWFPF